MNYELIMLKGADRMRRSAKSLTKEIQNIAVSSYSTLNWRDGTMGQIEKIAELTEIRNDCLAFYNAVVQALKLTDKAYRALLYAVYFKRVDKIELCRRYNVTVTTLYRKVWQARMNFKSCLEQLGYTENWFVKNYSDAEARTADALKA
ncbi:MAG: hypothetical protein NC332_05765 [Firmicutes bacterium]|nr:hypothetical protein [Bacillota bacterium]